MTSSHSSATAAAPNGPSGVEWRVEEVISSRTAFTTTSGLAVGQLAELAAGLGVGLALAHLRVKLLTGRFDSAPESISLTMLDVGGTVALALFASVAGLAGPGKWLSRRSTSDLRDH